MKIRANPFKPSKGCPSNGEQWGETTIPSSPSSVLLSFLQYFLPEDLLVPHHPPTHRIIHACAHTLTRSLS